jgi:hypothetical protein
LGNWEAFGRRVGRPFDCGINLNLYKAVPSAYNIALCKVPMAVQVESAPKSVSEMIGEICRELAVLCWSLCRWNCIKTRKYPVLLLRLR